MRGVSVGHGRRGHLARAQRYRRRIDVSIDSISGILFYFGCQFRVENFVKRLRFEGS